MDLLNVGRAQDVKNCMKLKKKRHSQQSMIYICRYRLSLKHCTDRKLWRIFHVFGGFLKCIVSFSFPLTCKKSNQTGNLYRVDIFLAYHLSSKSNFRALFPYICIFTVVYCTVERLSRSTYIIALCYETETTLVGIAFL